MNELSLDSLLNNLSASTNEPLDKKASETISVADELKDTLIKTASDNTEENTMKGKDIAASILAMLDGHNKEASNNVIVEHDKMVADDDKRDELTPREGKTVTETAKAIQARGAAKGSTEQEGVVIEAEGKAGAANPAVSSDLDKKAAVDELMAEGISFEEAVELVKKASAELAEQEEALEKAAAVNELVSQGISFDEAVTLVKEASEAETEYTDLEKAAAVSELMSQDGLDFDEAVELVKEASRLGK